MAFEVENCHRFDTAMMRGFWVSDVDYDLSASAAMVRLEKAYEYFVSFLLASMARKAWL